MNGWWCWMSTSKPAGANNDEVQLTLDWKLFKKCFTKDYELFIADGVCIFIV